MQILMVYPFLQCLIKPNKGSNMKVIFFIFALIALTACSDATRGAFSSLGDSRQVKCYSGGSLIYEGLTTGKVNNEQQSDGIYFTDKAGSFIEINADCVISNPN